MRRLAEILAFPKAWYRRTIVRRLFLGDLGILEPVNEMKDNEEVAQSAPKDENNRRESSNSANIANGSGRYCNISL